MSVFRMVMILSLTFLLPSAACGGLHTMDSSIWARPGARAQASVASDEIRTILSLPDQPAELASGPQGASPRARSAEPRRSSGAERQCSSSDRAGDPAGNIIVATLSDGGFVVDRGDGVARTIPMGSMPEFWRAF